MANCDSDASPLLSCLEEVVRRRPEEQPPEVRSYQYQSAIHISMSKHLVHDSCQSCQAVEWPANHVTLSRTSGNSRSRTWQVLAR
jgi:hypothetical protein